MVFDKDNLKKLLDEREVVVLPALPHRLLIVRPPLDDPLPVGAVGHSLLGLRRAVSRMQGRAERPHHDEHSSWKPQHRSK